ncbi:MAG: MBOAT family protein [Nitrospirae bacterium]|nr:MBOAT family protein [Nitrospirota bacterium]
MMQITYSLVFIIISVLIYWLLLPAKWRSVFLLAVSIFFMSLFSIKYTLYLFLNVLLVYLTGTYIKRSEKNRKLLLISALTLLIGNLLFFKYADLALNAVFKSGAPFSALPVTTFSKILMPVGMSYILFRLIHYIVEIYRKTLPEHSFRDLALYVFFFPTFLAGPVDRFQNVQPQTAQNNSLDPSDINNGLLRIISGLIKKFVVADSLKPFIMPVLSSPNEYTWTIVMLSVYGIAIQIYMDFSGYTDMALGVARLFGYKIIENFNYPYLKKNITLYWRNWHMSVYSFIRDYFFFPFFGYKATQAKIYAGMFLTMVAFCLWHGGSLHFLILGVYHGTGLVVWQCFQEIKSRHKRLRKFVDSKYLDPASIFLTFNFVSLGHVIFAFEMDAAANIFRRIFLPS